MHRLLYIDLREDAGITGGHDKYYYTIALSILEAGNPWAARERKSKQIQVALAYVWHCTPYRTYDVVYPMCTDEYPARPENDNTALKVP